MSAATTLNPKADDDRFPSLASLRVSHSELLKRHREGGNTPEILAEIEQLMHKGRATGALLDSEDDRWAAQGLLDYWSSLLYRSGQEPPDATLVDFDPALAPDLSDDLCPYMGLEAFREKNQTLFFGRQRLIDKLLKHLETNRLLVVVGSSGSGKSSLVLAGLLPRLLAGALPGSQDWFYYAPLVPGSDPLAALARRLKPANASATEWVPQQASAFKRNPNHLVQLVEQPDHQPIVVIIDQLEEIFTLSQDNEARQALVKNLLNFLQTPNPRNILILTIRTDFESQFVRTPDLLPLFEQSHIRVTALDAGELRETIERPAEMVGLKFEEKLVDALLSDVLGEPAALPLLQFTLLKLWDNREHNRVTWEAYRRLGGGRLALARSADEFYNNLIPEEQLTVKRILLQMVRPSEGLEVTSNRSLRKELYLSGEARDRVDRVLGKLMQARLVRFTQGNTPDDAQVEVAHEALIRNWPRLIDWLENERITLRQRLELNNRAEQWRAEDRDPNLLLRGNQLQEALCYANLTDLQNEFVQVSYKAEKKRARLRAVIPAMVATTFLIAIGSLISFMLARQVAQKNEQLNRALNLLQSSDETSFIGSLNSKTGLASAIKAAGDSLKQFNQVLDPVENNLRNSLRAFLPELRTAEFVAFQADNRYVVTTQENGTATVWQLLNGQRLAQFFPFQIPLVVTSQKDKVPSDIISVAVSEDMQYIFTANKVGHWYLWNRQAGQHPIATLHKNSDFITSVDISSDHSLIAGGSRDGTVKIWRWKDDQVTVFLESTGDSSIENEYVTSVSISPNNQLIASGFSNGKVRLWLTEGSSQNKPCTVFDYQDGYVTEVVFLDTRTVVASGTAGRSFQWKLNTPAICDQSSPRRQISEFPPRDRWQNLLNLACNNKGMQDYLANPVEFVTRRAKETCEQYVWSQSNVSRK